MANEKNLKPFNKRTEREQREIAKKGGKKSGEIRRDKKKIKETLKELLNLEAPENLKEKLFEKFPNLKNKKINLQTAMSLSLIINATNTNSNNSISAFIALRDTIGEKPIDKLDNINPSVVINNKMSFKDLQKLKKELDE